MTLHVALRAEQLEHRGLSVDLVLRLEIVRIGSSPVAIQSRSNLSVFHFKFLSQSPSMLSRRTMRRPGTGGFQIGQESHSQRDG